MAQAAASPIDTSGCSGLVGGFLPVDSFQVAVMALRAAIVAPNVAASASSEYAFEAEAIGSPSGVICSFVRTEGSYPARGGGTSLAGADDSATARRSGCRVDSSQYGVVSRGSVISTRTAPR